MQRTLSIDMTGQHDDLEELTSAAKEAVLDLVGGRGMDVKVHFSEEDERTVSVHTNGGVIIHDNTGD
jgi:hypothetical protein